MNFGLDKITTLTRLVKELSVGLIKLSFGDNFESFKETVSIPATGTVTLRNKLLVIPSMRVIVRQNLEGVISDSTTAWSKDFVYLTNHHATNTVILTVIFFK